MARSLPDVPCREYDEARTAIRSGDILFCSGTAPFSRLIQAATGSPWSHVGCILWAKAIDRLLVFESVESIGVRAVALRSYVENYNGLGKPYPGRLFVGRHDGMILAEDLSAFFHGAVDRLGWPYDRAEIAVIAARIAGREPKLVHGQERAFICSEFAAACFETIGLAIPYDRRGFIAPADFAACSRIKVLWEIATPP